MEMEEGFGDLLRKAEQLTAEMDNGTDLPRVDRSLPQIMEMAHRMSNKSVTTSQENSQVKASLLLGPRGYDVQKMTQKLENLSTIKSFDPIEPIRETDVHAFLKNERENALLSIIEHTKKTTFEEVEKKYWDSVYDEWEREKQRILNALVGCSSDILDSTQDPEITASNVSMRGRSTMDNNEMAYARQVFVYNEAVIQGAMLPNLTDMFIDVAQKNDNMNVKELWMIVRHMTDIQTNSASSVAELRTSQKAQAAFTNQALKYLQDTYVTYMKNTVNSNLQQAQLGGIPGVYHLVRSFLNVRSSASAIAGLEDGVIDGYPLWAMVYYCLRSGDATAARQVVSAARQHLGDFAAFIEEHATSPDGRLSHCSENKIRMLYRRHVRNCHDPYKRAVYCVLGRCDPLADHNEIAEKTEDYLWLKLKQLSFETDDDEGQGTMTLAQLQTLLLEEYGENHFGGYQQPFLYFQVLLLTAQFEAAIEFMSRIERLRCHAVHVAMTLYELHMLLLPQSIQAQMLSRDPTDEKPLRRLNFARLLTMYTRKFEMTDPREALQYFHFLRKLKNSQGENLFLSCVSDLVLETREFEMLLGQICRDGGRKPGAIDKFNADTQRIIELVAIDTETKGLFEDAVKLYDLAQNYDKVLELLNKLLTQVLAQHLSPQSNKDRLKKLAVSIAERYRTLGLEGNRQNTMTFYLLLDLMTFFDLYHSGKIDQAYNVIQELKILPFTKETVEQKIKDFKYLADEIRRTLPDILITSMSILYSLYKAAREGGGSLLIPGERKADTESYVSHLRVQAKALITFAGMIPYRMPGDTNARLVQTEVLMN